ncbi:TPA: ribonuclease H [Candidatus Falkowbacteria bacterium]|nr:ribonuclease H [Candidatus Falkowbacteria bacterium]
MKLKIYSDGGARGNPGPAGIGVVIYNQDGDVVHEISKYIGETTNNQAEYQAIIAGLKYAKSIKAPEVDCYLDSELVVKQVNGEYKVKDQNLAEHFLTIWNLKKYFKTIRFSHVRREQNKAADKLVNQALDLRSK